MQPNVHLQSPSLGDVEQIHAWAEDSEVSEYFRRFPPLCEWRLPEQTLAGIAPAFSIYEAGKIVGLIQLVNYDASVKSIEIGLLVDNRLCSNRKAVSLESYSQLCEYLFETLNYSKLYMKILDHREKLLHRLVEAHWRLEGSLIKSCKHQGQPRNELLLGLLKEDWEAWRGK